MVLFDHVGGGSDLSLYDPARHASLQGYADDVLAICDELDLQDVVFVGHSVSAMVGVPGVDGGSRAFAQLVMQPVPVLHRRR
ncbi:hypothetical protein BH18ACT9_BH18ACT9_20180 [soil metagenome]